MLCVRCWLIILGFQRIIMNLEWINSKLIGKGKLYGSCFFRYRLISGFEGDALLAQAAIFFVAGRETSITTMTYVLCELAKYPEMQRRAREEILEKIQTANGVTYEAVNDMKYLHQVINETLRLYPPAPILDRTPAEDYTV